MIIKTKISLPELWNAIDSLMISNIMKRSGNKNVWFIGRPENAKSRIGGLPLNIKPQPMKNNYQNA